MGNKQSKDLSPDVDVRTRQSLFSLGRSSQDLSRLDLRGGYEAHEVYIPDSNDNTATKEIVHWTHSIDFILATFGFAVGFGNFWRFPYKMYKHGGGAFLIPYLIILLCFGLPMFYMEMILGQYISYGPIKIFGEMAPISKGVGYSMVALTTCFSIYYNVINVWCIHYFISSFGSELPWTSDEDSAEKYFKNEVLHLNPEEGITWWNFGPLHWKLTLFSFICWAIIAAYTVRGIQFGRNMIRFTAVYPLCLLVILCAVSLSKEGGTDGVLEFFNIPDLEDLFKPLVWKEACIQVIFSLGLGMGILPNLARYNNFNNNCLTDAILVILGDTIISILASVVGFSFLGIAAKKNGEELDPELIKEGPTVTFAVLMEGLTQVSDKAWIVHLVIALFSISLLTVGMNSMFANVDVIISALLDQFSWLKRLKSKYV